MKKKILATVSAVALIAALLICLAACNPFKWDSIGAGDSNEPAVSNGGYAVQQGRYLYYINGYAGTDADNSWGTPVKQSLVRAELDENGNVKADTNRIVVPKLIFNSTTDGGFAIFGSWIYYATTNSDKDKTGTPSTTNMDFMRTKNDGSVTQLLGRISSRSAKYIFTEHRVLYYLNNAINYIDFSSLNSKPNKNGKGTKTGVLAENVSSVMWAYGLDEVFYTKTITGDDSYKHYNELCSIKVDGTGARTLASQKTFIGDKDPAENYMQIYQYTLNNIYVESDGSVTLYYLKSHTEDSSTIQDGLYMANVSAISTSVNEGEKKDRLLINTNSTSVTVYPLGYDNGAIVSTSAGNYLQDGKGAVGTGVQVTDSSQTIWFVYGDYAYYTASSATALSRIKYKTPGVSETVFEEGIYTSFMKLDTIGTKLYFFASDDDNYMHAVDFLSFDKNAKDEDGEPIKTDYIGFAREEEADA